MSRSGRCRVSIVGWLLASLAIPGCQPPLTPQCTASNDPGVRVTVLTGTFGRAVTDATLTLRDGDYTEVMQLISPELGQYVGAFERPGTYTLTVEKFNYETQVIENIVVGGDPCHIEPVQLEVLVFPVQSH